MDIAQESTGWALPESVKCSPIASLMQRQVELIDLDDTAAEVEALFTERHLSWAPVGSADDRIVGVISSADLVRLHSQVAEFDRKRAWELCTYQPVVVGSATPVAEVARQMLERHIHHVVVVDDGRLVGVVSALDFVRSFA